MKAQKLPSGSWRVQIMLNGKRVSVTAETEDEAIYKAMMLKTGREREQKKSTREKTVKSCVQEYIESKENLLSPSSIRGYYIILNNSLELIENVKVKELSEKHLQQWVNLNAKNYAPKSIKSQFGLVTAALRQEKVNLDFSSVLLPRIEHKEPVIPNEQQMTQILQIVEGTSVELPVTIAVTLGLRQSEIAGLKWSDYDGALLDIHAAKVPDKYSKFVYKDYLKSKASKRKLEVEGILKERLDRAERKGEFISPMLPSSVLRKFNHLCDKNGLPRFTMHAERHANASEMLVMGVPDKYAMKRLGQSSPNMIKNVYQHLFEDKEKEYSKALSSKFETLMNKKTDPENDTKQG